jgi:uncharacterized DUF497 family protein
MSHDAEWDEEKNLRNQTEKGVAFEDCIDIFKDVCGIIEQQERQGEVRFKLTGRASEDILTVVFTWRGKTRRIISAWPASRQERRAYLGR